MKSLHQLGLFLGAALVAVSGTAHAQYRAQYEVSITNITAGQTFTPQLVVSHKRRASLFELGGEASEALEILAEDGDTGPLIDDLVNDSTQAETIGGLLGPGETASIALSAVPRWDVLSVAAMLIPTNDTFVALDGVALPRRGSRSYLAQAYDAGTEFNDQSCANMPGPRCGGEGFNAAGGEGFVHVGNGFHTLEQVESAEILGPQVYDWRNPVARITVRRIY